MDLKEELTSFLEWLDGDDLRDLADGIISEDEIIAAYLRFRGITNDIYI